MSRSLHVQKLGSAGKSLRLEPLEDRLLLSATPAPDFAFDTITLEDEFSTGGGSVPPDPHGAAGPTHVVNVVNQSIQWHTKTGITENTESFTSFFSRFSPVTVIDEQFDPKVLYDQYADRFVVVALELVDPGAQFDPGNLSRIWLAVSDDSDPNGDWHVQVINSRETTAGGVDIWFDYPGFAVDEEAIYVTGNMFQFGPRDFEGSRLFIIAKNQGAGGGLYNGGVSTVTRHDPAGEFNLGQEFAGTLQPAHTYGTMPSGVGIFLVSTSVSVSTAFPRESVGIYRIDNPLSSTPTFSRQILDVGDIHDESVFPIFRDTPQLGSLQGIDFGDTRAYEAVWRDNTLWAVNTVVPKNGPDAGQATVHWYKIDTSDLTHLVLADQGNVGGEDIGPQTHTSYGSLAVNAAGDLAIGFAASGFSTFAGAYYTGRRPSDPAGTVRSSAVLAAGQDVYVRTFGGGRNRWGDYSGISVDPADDASFWVFNEYAAPRGLPDILGEDGNWATRFGRFNFDGSANVPPVANNDSATTDMITPVVIDVLANDTDVNIPLGDAILPSTVIVVTPPANGLNIVNPINGEVTYTPNTGFFGTDSFTYTVEDFFGGVSNVATVSIQVADTRPVAVDDAASTTINTPSAPIDVAANDFDIGLGTVDPSTVMIMTPPVFGTTVVNGATGEITYTPNSGIVGGDSFTYRVRDDAGNLSNEAMVQVRIGAAVSFTGTVFADINNDGVRGASEVGIEHVAVTVRNDFTGSSQTVFTAADGSYTFAESPGGGFVLPGGSYTITETQPIAYHDGIDTAGAPGAASAVNDRFNGVVAAPGTAVAGYMFGERGLRAEFFDAFLNGSLYTMHSSAGTHGWHNLSGLNPGAGPIWVAFNDGTEGDTTFGATFGGGSVALGIYDTNMNLLTSSSSAGGLTQINFAGTSGAPYLLKVSGTASAVALDISAPDVQPAGPGQNSPPVFDPIADRMVNEGGVVTFQITATDAENNNIRFFLDASAPAGASINPTTGWFTWATDAASPTIADFTILAIDDGQPEQFAETSFQITIDRPIIDPTKAVTVSGPVSGVLGVPQTFNFTLNDPAPGTYLFVIDWEGDGALDEAVAGTSGVTLNHTFAGRGVYNVTVNVVDPLGNWSEPFAQSITIAAPSTNTPSVVDVFVAGSNWSPNVLNQFEAAGMGTGGYSIMPGAGEAIQTLAYGAIDKIKVVFSDDATVSEGDLQLAGVNVASYAFAPGGFSYDPATRTAIWTLAAPIGIDKLALHVGGAAKEFQLRFNIAPGDVDGNGLVDIGDFTSWADSFEATGVQRADFNANGIVDIGDFTVWVDHANSSLPTSEPSMPGGPVSGGGGGGGGGGSAAVDVAFSDWESDGLTAGGAGKADLAVQTSDAVVANDQGAVQPGGVELGWIMMRLLDESSEEDEVFGIAL